MPRHIDEIAADFDALEASDFDYRNAQAAGWERLEFLCEEMRELNDVALCAPVMFRTMERLDEVELGTPGPLVHTLEYWRGGYEAYLVESIHRKPSFLAVWMVNRILNRHPGTGAWLAVLRTAMNHPLACDATKTAAAAFFQHQTEE